MVRVMMYLPVTIGMCYGVPVTIGMCYDVPVTIGMCYDVPTCDQWYVLWCTYL